MTAPGAGADRWCCRAVQLAAHVLPAEHRHRYALEFIAELYGMPRPRQVRHSVQVLSRAWALRAALADVAPAPTQENAMKLRTARPFLCRLNLHHRWRWASTEDGERYEHCVRCGKDRSEKASGGPHGGAAGIGSSM
jgi:hypothetical protein